MREKELTLEIIYINKNTPNIIVKQLLEEINREEYFIEFDDNKKVSFKYNGLNLNINGIMAGDIVEPMQDLNSKVREVSKLILFLSMIFHLNIFLLVDFFHLTLNLNTFY